MDNSHWSSLIEDGETIIKINFYQLIHLRVLTQVSLFLQRNKISRGTLLGKLYWSIFEALKIVCKISSPSSFKIFWFWVDARWVLSSLNKNKLGINSYEYQFIRKKNINTKDIRMNFRDYKAVNDVRKHI